MFGDYISYVDGVMNYTSAKNGVIANNVSNINTPGFKEQEVKFKNILNGEMKTPLLTNEVNHINKNVVGADMEYEVITPTDHNKRIDENNVDQTEQMVEMMKANYTHNLSVTTLNGEFDLLRSAIGG